MLFLFPVFSSNAVCNTVPNLAPDTVAFGKAYTSIDFKDIVSNPSTERAILKGIIVRIKSINNNEIKHTLPDINRCCQIAATEKVHYDGVDKIPRDNCAISKSDFFDKYVWRRKPVLLNGCQDTWAAKNWTFRGNTLFFMLDVTRAQMSNKGFIDHTTTKIFINCYRPSRAVSTQAQC